MDYTKDRCSASSSVARREHGFTVIAMAAILMVASIAMTLLLPDEGAVNNERMRITQHRMEKIHASMEHYVLAKGNLLPCPARVDRYYSATQFQRSVTECDKAATLCDASRMYNGVFCNPGSGVVAGAVPVMQLNLGDEYMLDGWGNKIIYVVDSTMTRMAMVPPGYQSVIQVYGVDGNAPRTLRGQRLFDVVGQKPLGLLISSGVNANGAVGSNGVRKNCDTGAYDGQNCDFGTDMMLYTADRARGEDGSFDDILVPIILEQRSCKEPVPCTQEKCTAFNLIENVCAVPTTEPVKNTTLMDAREQAIFSAKGDTPYGCVHTGLAPIGSAWPIGAGDNVHGAARTLRSGGNILCCDGRWQTGGSC